MKRISVQEVRRRKKKKKISSFTRKKMSNNFHFSHQQTSLHKASMSNVKSWHYYCPAPADKALKTTTGGKWSDLYLMTVV